MTAEQLQHARAAAFHQDGRPLLTADAAAVWLRETGLCLLHPRPREIAAPAPSLVEATLGRSEPEPALDALATAAGLLRRLVASGDAVPLHLLGAAGPGSSDQPDLLCTGETLPFVYALRGDREWTRGPRGKASPLGGEVWKLLGRDGALTAAEIRDGIGRHLTESAALRALGELWADLRVEPLYGDDGDTRWQRLETRHERSMTDGSAMAQGTALSALVSLYLQTAIAATEDEIEAFLSPLASRSRVREAVRGLHTTRQLGVRNLGPREHFYVEGSLPAFADGVAATPPNMLPEVSEPTDRVVVGEIGSEVVVEVVGEGGGFRIEALSEAETERERSVGEGRKRFVAARGASGGDRKSYGARPPAGGKPSPGEGRKPFFAREPWKEDRRPSTPRAGAGDGSEGTGDRRSFAPRADGGGFSGGAKKPFAPREGGRPPFGGDRKPFAPREGRPSSAGGGDRRPFAPREGGRPSFGGGDRKPFAPREGNDRRPFGGGSAPATGNPRGEASGRPFQKPFQKSYDKSFRKPFAEGDAREKRPFSPRPGPGAGPQTTSRSGPPSGHSSSEGARPPRRPFSPSGGGYTPREEGSGRKPFPSRPGGDRDEPRPARGGFAPRGAGSFRPREEGGRPPENRGQGGQKPPFRARPYASRDREGSAPDRGPERGYDRGGAPGRRPFAQPFQPANGGEGKRPFTPRAGGAGKPFRRAGEGFEGDTPRRTGRPDAPAGPGRFDREGGRPSRPGAPAGGSKRPRTAPFTSTGKPRPGVGATGRPGPRSARPGTGPRKPGSKGGPKRP